MIFSNGFFLYLLLEDKAHCVDQLPFFIQIADGMNGDGTFPWLRTTTSQVSITTTSPLVTTTTQDGENYASVC